MGSAVNSPKRILYVHHGSGQGGAANSLLCLLRGLDRTRYQPIVACDFSKPKAKEFFLEHGFEPVNMPIAPFTHTMKTWTLYTIKGFAKFWQWLLMKQPASRRAFRSLLEKVKPDIVHFNGLSILPLSPLARRRGIPVVQHVRESVNEGCLGMRKRWLLLLAKKFTSYIIYICVDNQERLTGEMSCASVIYNPVDFDKFTATNADSCKKKFNIPCENTVLFFPGGSFWDIKGIIPFLQSLALIRKVHSNLNALIPGLDVTSHPRERIRRQIKETLDQYDLQDIVLRLPFSNAVEEYYAVSDVVVAPFLVPHFSRAVIEAGAMAKPVVGSRIGGITEVLDDEVTGFLVTPGDATELAEKIIYLIENPDRAATMGRSGFLKARGLFDARNHAKLVMGIYDHILSS